MKNLLLLALALVMTCTFAFAQSQTPYSKGKYYGKQIITLAFENDEDGIDRLCASVESYIEDYVETEDDLENLLNGLEAGLREGCKAYGLSDEDADELVEYFGYSLLEGLLEDLMYYLE